MRRLWTRVLLGVLAVAAVVLLLDGGRRDDDGPPPSEGEPDVVEVGDHAHAVFGVFVCDGFLPPPTDVGSAEAGIHTHGDGLVHIHPSSERVAGDAATLGVFLETVGIEADAEAFAVPGGVEVEDGDRCPGADEPAQVRLLVDGKPVEDDPDDLVLRPEQVIVLSFSPTRAEVPPPPWLDELDAPADAAG